MLEDIVELGRKSTSGVEEETEGMLRFLESQAIVPQYPDNLDREVIINLDREEEKVEFKLGDELYEDRPEEYLSFGVSGNQSKVFFTTKNLYYHLLTIPHMLNYIESNGEDIWKDHPNEREEFLNFLEDLYDTFCVADFDRERRPNRAYLRIDKFSEEDRNIIIEALEKAKNRKRSESKKKMMSEVKERILNSEPVEDVIDDSSDWSSIHGALLKPVQQMTGANKQDISDLNVFKLTVDGKDILEFPDYGKAYIRLAYYVFMGRFFKSQETEDSYCGICGDQAEVTKKIDMDPARMYITENPCLFTHMNRSLRHHSFAACRECFRDLRVGIKKIDKEYRNYLFGGINYYAIPIAPLNGEAADIEGSFIHELLKESDQNVQERLDTLSQFTEEDIKFRFLFWFIPEGQGASFVVREETGPVHIKWLEDVFVELNNVARNFPWTNLFGDYEESRYRDFHFNDIFSLFAGGEQKNFYEEVVILLKKLFAGNKIDPDFLLRMFLDTMKYRHFNREDNEWTLRVYPSRMAMMLSWFSRLNLLEGGNSMGERSDMFSVTEIMGGEDVIDQYDEDSEDRSKLEDINSYFEEMPARYRQNPHAHGIFLLGYLINRVLYKQNQEGKSSTVLNKINFGGISPDRVGKLVNDVTDMLRIYELFSYNKIYHALMTKKIAGIEDTELSREEIVYILLSGLSFGSYLGRKYSRKANENNEEGGDKE